MPISLASFIRQLRRTLLLLVLTLATSMTALSQETEAVVPGQEHLVFAHYMTCFTASVEFYKQEIELAQRHGIDGFALNCGEWLKQDKATGEWKQTNYVPAAERMYEAARQLDSGFKLFFSPDVNGLRDLPVNMGDMVTRFYDHPNQLRYGEKRVISAWAGTPLTYREAIETLKADGREIFFVPFLYPPKWKMAWSYETVLDFFHDQPHMDGLFYFAADDSVNGLMRRNAIGRRVTQHLGKLYMAGASPAYNSANLRDFRGMEGYGAMWEGLIRDGADWVELVTWNDYQEDSNLMPFRWPSGQDRDYFVRDESYLDVSGYYSVWYKTGIAPEVTQDKLYISYRNRSVWQRQAWNEKAQAWEDVVTTTNWPFDQPHDDAQDLVYVTTFLTAPATLTVELGGKTASFEQPAGIAHVSIPLVPGVPRAILTRSGAGDAPLIDVVGRQLIIDQPTEANSAKGLHLLNRTWTNGAVAGAGKQLPAVSGELSEGATVETVAGRRAVRNLEADGSGVTLPVTGLSTGTYAVRITYSNPAATVARLTMTADGPPRGAGEFPHFIPLWLPPTGEGTFVTTSYLWSLYDTTTYLDLKWRGGITWGNKPKPADNDRGSVLIESIELVRVEPVVASAKRDRVFPEMVAIPGGAFTMGTDDGRPDEGPAHKVTMPTFAMSKYEITNALYERFNPEHRDHRDGFSWRDREPVIYVSWKDGVTYCNWLSEQAGLTPAYALVEDATTKRKEWQVDMAADGFRLPTEAEWEYVATGRGEGRTYPWGNDTPVPGTHGNFKGDNALRIDRRVPSDGEGGVMTVGAYPAGASRDGVMDLAGNVAEWCSDTFLSYTPDAATNPIQQAPSPYRSIRGSSWDYYGCPLEAVDREYNNGGYPGYIYLGLRVVLPEAGMRKLAELKKGE